MVQRVQLKYVWRYLLLAVDPLRGRLCWTWLLRMNAEHLLPVLQQWKLRVVVWDGAPAHRAKAMNTLETLRIRQPAYAPELNPAERIFLEVRRHTEGRRYDSLEAKQKAAEGYLQTLNANPERVKRLCGWHWIRQALDSLPPASPAR